MKPKFVSLAEAVTLLDLAGRYRRPELWLRRVLRRREKQLGMRILIADGVGRGARYRVNVATLESVLVELKSPRDVASERLAERLASLERSVRATNERLDELDGKLAALVGAFNRLRPAGRLAA